MKKQTTTETSGYEAPRLELLSVQTERGFAESDGWTNGINPDGNNGWNLDE